MADNFVQEVADALFPCTVEEIDLNHTVFWGVGTDGPIAEYLAEGHVVGNRLVSIATMTVWRKNVTGAQLDGLRNVLAQYTIVQDGGKQEIKLILN